MGASSNIASKVLDGAHRIDLFLHQQGLDTMRPAGKAMFQMMGVFAEFERAMIQERVRAGLARAKSEGKRLGRPPIDPALEKRIREALAAPDRPGVRKIAARFRVNPGTVQRIAALSRQARSQAPEGETGDDISPSLGRIEMGQSKCRNALHSEKLGRFDPSVSGDGLADAPPRRGSSRNHALALRVD
jgi:hypothetical protein